MRLKPRDDAPNFKLPGVDGKKYSLDKDKVNVVIFTCNHCPYAQAYQERIKTLVYDFPDVQFLAINSNDSEGYPDDSFDNMKIRSKQEKFNFPYLRDHSQQIARAYGAEVTPDCFIVDKAGKIRYTGRFDNNWSDPSNVTQKDLRIALDEVLSGGKVRNNEMRAIGCSIKWKS